MSSSQVRRGRHSRAAGGSSTPFPYEDILGCERPVPCRAPMARADRAAQFAPFAALTGHKEVIAERAQACEEAVLSEEEWGEAGMLSPADWPSSAAWEGDWAPEGL